MTSEVDHVLLTRFNLPSPGHESYVRNQSGWLEGRVQLFERYCLPSARRQRDARFSWLVYFDPESPDWLVSWVNRVADGAFIPLFRQTVSPAEVRVDLDTAVPRKARRLVTTNLDNDDGLGLDFVASVHRFRAEAPRVALYFARGLVLGPSGLYLRTDRGNAFCSVSESWDEPVTCWADWHNRLHLSMPVAVVSGEPQWLQVIHGSNVSNRTRGRLVSPRDYLDSFIGLENIADPSQGQLWVDRFALNPGRIARDSTRSSIRRAAVATIGKERVNSVKESLARTRPGALRSPTRK